MEKSDMEKFGKKKWQSAGKCDKMVSVNIVPFINRI